MQLESSIKLSAAMASALAEDIKLANIDKDCMKDPLNTSFYDEIWCRAAENNTKIYRRVFRIMPDSEATNWAEYKEFDAYNKRFKASLDGHLTTEEAEKPDVNEAAAQQSPSANVAAGIGAPGPAAIGKAAVGKVMGGIAPIGGDDSSRLANESSDPVMDEKSGLSEGAKDEQAASDSVHDEEKAALGSGMASPSVEDGAPNGGSFLKPNDHRERRPTFSTPERPERPPRSAGGASSTGFATDAGGTVKSVGSTKRRRRAATRSSRRGFNPADELLSRAEAEDLLNMTQGTLVQFPYDWLVVEETNGNWLFQVDQVAPLQI